MTTYYQSNDNNVTGSILAKRLYATSNTSSVTNHTTGVNSTTAMGWSELLSHGNSAGAWQALGAVGAQSGHGLLLDDTTLEGYTFVGGTWTTVMRLNSSVGSVVADIYVRYSVWHSGSNTYTTIGSGTLTAQTLNTTTTNYTVTATGLPSATLGTGDKLYIDLWLNITSNSQGSSTGTMSWSGFGTVAGGGSSLTSITAPAVVVTGTATASALTTYTASGTLVGGLFGTATASCATSYASITNVYNRHTAPPAVGPPLSLGYLSNYNGGFGVNGNRVRLQGATMYPYFTVGGTTYRGGAWQQATFPTYIDQVIQWVLAGKLTTIRVTDILEGTGVNPYNPTIKANLNYLMSKAKLYGLWVILDLSWYRNWLKANGHNNATCYDPGNYSTYLKWLVPQYAKHTSLAYWSLGGEPAAPTGTDPTRTTTAGLNAYYAGLYAQVRALDPNHLIGSGGLSYLNYSSGVDWQSIFTSVDMGAIHVYSHNDRDVTLPLVTPWCAAHNKPFLIEEFGIQQTPAGTPNWTTPYATQAAGYADILSRCDNVVFWNAGPEVGASSFDCDPTTQPNTWAQVVLHASSTRVTSRIRT